MPTSFPIIRKGDTLHPVNDEGLRLVRSLPEGQWLRADIVTMRNVSLHRKCFAYMQLAYEHWQPASESIVSRMERETVKRLGKYLVRQGIAQEAAQAVVDGYLSDVEASRQFMEFPRSFDQFRADMTIKAGYYEMLMTTDGPIKKAKSWAWINMPESEFKQLFEDIRRVCWDEILSQSYESIEQADAVAEQLMSFD